MLRFKSTIALKARLQLYFSHLTAPPISSQQQQQQQQLLLLLLLLHTVDRAPTSMGQTQMNKVETFKSRQAAIPPDAACCCRCLAAAHACRRSAARLKAACACHLGLLRPATRPACQQEAVAHHVAHAAQQGWTLEPVSGRGTWEAVTARQEAVQ